MLTVKLPSRFVATSVQYTVICTPISRRTRFFWITGKFMHKTNFLRTVEDGVSESTAVVRLMPQRCAKRLSEKNHRDPCGEWPLLLGSHTTKQAASVML